MVSDTFGFGHFWFRTLLVSDTFGLRHFWFGTLLVWDTFGLGHFFSFSLVVILLLNRLAMACEVGDLGH